MKMSHAHLNVLGKYIQVSRVACIAKCCLCGSGLPVKSQLRHGLMFTCMCTEVAQHIGTREWCIGKTEVHVLRFTTSWLDIDVSFTEYT